MQTINYITQPLWVDPYKTIFIVFVVSLVGCILLLLIGEIFNLFIWRIVAPLAICFAMGCMLCLPLNIIACKSYTMDIENSRETYTIAVDRIEHGELDKKSVAIGVKGDAIYLLPGMDYDTIAAKGGITVFDYDGETYLARNQ